MENENNGGNNRQQEPPAAPQQQAEPPANTQPAAQQQEPPAASQQQAPAGNTVNAHKHQREVQKLQDQLDAANKELEGYKGLEKEFHDYKASQEAEKVASDLKAAGCIDTVAASARLSEFDGDISKLKESAPYLFASTDKSKSTGGTQKGDPGTGGPAMSIRDGHLITSQIVTAPKLAARSPPRLSVIASAVAWAAPSHPYSSSRKPFISSAPALGIRFRPLMESAVKVDCRAAAFSASPMPFVAACTSPMMSSLITSQIVTAPKHDGAGRGRMRIGRLAAAATAG